MRKKKVESYSVHKITGYGTCSQQNSYVAIYKLIMWLTDIERAGLAAIYPWLIARVEHSESEQ